MVEQDLVPCLLEFLSVRRTYRFSNLTSTIFDTTINTKCTYVRNLKPWILTVPCRGALGLPICRNGGPWGCTPGPSPQIVAGQLTLYEPGRADSAHHITTWPTQILRPTTIHEFIYTNKYVNATDQSGSKTLGRSQEPMAPTLTQFLLTLKRQCWHKDTQLYWKD